MGTAKLNIGQKMLIDGNQYVLDREVTKDEWQIRSEDTGRYITRSKNELFELLADRRLMFVNSLYEAANDSSISMTNKESFMALGLLSEAIQKRTRIRYAYANAVDKANLDKYTKEMFEPVIDEVFSQIKEKHKKPSWWTVNRWHKKFIESGKDIRSLVTRNSRKGNRKRRYVRQFVDLVEKAINDVYMQREKNSIEDTVYKAIDLVKHENYNLPPSLHLPLPTESLVKSEIYKIPAYDRMVARKGKSVADRVFRTAIKSVVSDRPLERVEIDHTVLDVMLVDDNFLPIGRPTLTVCIDVYTRSVLGIYVGFEPPSFVTVAQCLKHAFLPKINLSEKYPAVKNDWIQYGVMEYLVVDNGLEFHGNDLEALCHAFGVSVMYMPRRKPWFKGIVERFIGSFNRGVCHGVPGTTFSSILDRDDYDAAKNATLTLSTFLEIVHVWIVDYYHQRKHKALGNTPVNVWNNNIIEHEIPLPSDVDDLDYLLGSVAERTLSHKGIELNSLRYNSIVLNELRLRKGPNDRVSIRYNKADLGYIHVIDPDTDKPIRVPALDQDYASGLSEWQHKVCKRYANDNFDRSDIEALAEAKETIRGLVASDMGNKRIKTRKRAHRFVNSADQEAMEKPVSTDITTPLRADTRSNQAYEQLMKASNDEIDDEGTEVTKSPSKLKIVKNNH